MNSGMGQPEYAPGFSVADGKPINGKVAGFIINDIDRWVQ